MQPFYTIIKIAPNPSAGDSLSIGLLLCGRDKYFLDFSTEKVRAIKNLMKEKAESVEFIEKQLKKYIELLNRDHEEHSIGLSPLKDLLNSDYFKYLSNYSNGILQFSRPSFIDSTATEEDFRRLYQLLVDKTPIKTYTPDLLTVQFNQNIREKLIERVKGKIHTDVEFDTHFSPAMYFNYNMDCIGLNGGFTGAKSIIFNKTPATLDKDISHFITLISLLLKRYKKNDAKNNFYLIADEPSVESAEHRTYEKVLEIPFFKVIPSGESDEVAEKVEETKAGMFLSF